MDAWGWEAGWELKYKVPRSRYPRSNLGAARARPISVQENIVLVYACPAGGALVSVVGRGGREYSML